MELKRLHDMTDYKDFCENYDATALQQLYKIVTDDENGGYKNKNVFPVSVIQSIFDGRDGSRLDTILSLMNCIYVPYQGSNESTRLKIKIDIRRKGLIVVFRDYNEVIFTQRYNGNSTTDDDWKLDNNWVNCFTDFNNEEIEQLKQYLTQYIDERIEGAGSIVVDSSLSPTSTNPVQNKVINEALNNKANSNHSHTANQVSGLTVNRVLVSDTGGHPSASSVTNTELGYLSNVTSNIQEQLNNKSKVLFNQTLSSGVLVGTINIDGTPTKIYAPQAGESVTYDQASSTELGLIKIGYAQNENNYPVELDNEGRAYVTVEGESSSDVEIASFDNTGIIKGNKYLDRFKLLSVSQSIAEQAHGVSLDDEGNISVKPDSLPLPLNVVYKHIPNDNIDGQLTYSDGTMQAPGLSPTGTLAKGFYMYITSNKGWTPIDSDLVGKIFIMVEDNSALNGNYSIMYHDGDDIYQLNKPLYKNDTAALQQILSQEEYNSLETKDNNTIYYIKG